MPRDTSGATQPLPGTIVSTGDTILPSQHNPMVNDVYAMLTQSLSRDGQGGMRAPLDMSGFRIFNVGPASSETDAVSLGQSKANGVPIGTIADFAGNSAPEKWFLCFGQAISRTEYADLYSIIGTTYGAGNGSTSFNIPDLRGRVSAGKDDMGGQDSYRLSGLFGSIARTLGGAMGLSYHVLTTPQIPKHTHPIIDPGHVHFRGVYQAQQGVSYVGPGGNPAFSGLGSTEPSFTGITMQSSGGDEPHNNTQPTFVLNKIIKASY